jgi:hypothetical protein
MNADRTQEKNGEAPPRRPSTGKPYAPDVLRAAVAALLELLAEGKAVRALVERDGLRGELTVGPIAEAAPAPSSLVHLPPPTPAPCSHWLWLSPIEAEVIQFLEQNPREWMTCERIASAVSPISGRDLGCVMRNMADRNILESQTGKGYRLAKPEGHS